MQSHKKKKNVAIAWICFFVSYSKLMMEQTVIATFLSMVSNVKVIEPVAVIALLLDDDDEEKEDLPKRSQWVRPWMSRRKTDVAFHTIFQELKQEDAEGFRGYIRLDTKSFEKCVNFPKASLLWKDTNMRECIKPEEMCCVTLRYFASRESFQ